MSNRCNSCSKLCGLEMADPEVELDLSDTTVSFTARIVRMSECCGEEVKEANFDGSDDIAEKLIGHVDADGHELEGHDLELKESDAEATERCEGRGRGMKSFYGFCVTYEVSCSCQKPGDKPLHEGEFSDDTQASHMEDLG